MAFLLNLSSKTELSPKGFVNLLSFLHDVINSDSKQFMMKIFKNCLKLLCSLVRENQLLAVQEWPGSSGGGLPAACMITTHILRIFNIPFVQPFYEKEAEPISVDMGKLDIVHLTLNSVKYLSNENIPIAISLIQRLVFTNECSKNFAQ
jgi:fused